MKTFNLKLQTPVVPVRVGQGAEESMICLKPWAAPTRIFTRLYMGSIPAKTWLPKPGGSSRSDHSLTSEVLNFTHHLLSGVHLLGLVILSLIAKARH